MCNTELVVYFSHLIITEKIIAIICMIEIFIIMDLQYGINIEQLLNLYKQLGAAKDYFAPPPFYI